ncbi:MAG: BamA/TamA family outer membrane protein [Desulfarculaceae bacterium]|nr:BamA/TamA family outer membrane protein [Desulfarculaceae bacterium]MCF8071454.1 BamA/TamA family outer membrane protein [Desulfarculaceae bacterium]MCF8103418.1 BamA/TamA family outer membrane protein [Desulfarculaceae bacterium]MCF8117841.1 BamA/TamA family outer membrane protein [Desulfarculaceae bacterium]
MSKRLKALWLGAALTALLFCLPGMARAINITPPWVVYDQGQTKAEPRWLALPYAFYSDTYSFAGGVAGGGTGYLQEQMAFFAAGLGSTNSTFAGYFYLVDMQAPVLDRLFITVDFSDGYYTKQRVYAQGNPAYRNEQAGSNSSNKNDYLEGKGWYNWFDLVGKFVLPLGAGRNKIIQRYWLKGGLLAEGASGGSEWNPLESGVSEIRLRAFAQDMSVDGDQGDYSFRTNGLEASFIYDNRDYPGNPNTGSYQSFTISHDFGWFDSSGSWNNLELDLRKYFSLGNDAWFKQKVLAFDLWTAYSESWQSEDSAGDIIVDSRTPPNFGPTLGGFYRMRGYPKNRFADKAAIYYAGELRLTARANPLGDISWLKFADIDWMQVVLFGELGRVADSYDPSEFVSDLKWDAGIGFRFMAQKTVLRVDLAHSDEGMAAWAMVGHPF